MINNVNTSQISFSGAVEQFNSLSRRLCGSRAIFSPGHNGRMFVALPVDGNIKINGDTLIPLIGEGKGKLGAAIDALKQIRRGDILVLEDRAIRVTRVKGGIRFETLA